MRNLVDLRFFSVMLIGFVFMTSACSSSGTIKKMRKIQPVHSTLLPQDGKSLIVFVRPADSLYSVQADIVEVIEGNLELVGIFASGTWMTYHTTPGTHLFMSAGIGSETEFMSADILPNKIYYVLVKSWTNGLGRSKYYLNPIRRASPESGKLQKMLNKYRLVEKISESEDWIRNNMPNLRARLATDEQEWQSRHDSERSNLRENDDWNVGWVSLN